MFALSYSIVIATFYSLKTISKSPLRHKGLYKVCSAFQKHLITHLWSYVALAALHFYPAHIYSPLGMWNEGKCGSNRKMQDHMSSWATSSCTRICALKVASSVLQ